MIIWGCILHINRNKSMDKPSYPLLTWEVEMQDIPTSFILNPNLAKILLSKNQFRLWNRVLTWHKGSVKMKTIWQLRKRRTNLNFGGTSIQLVDIVIETNSHNKNLKVCPNEECYCFKIILRIFDKCIALYKLVCLCFDKIQIMCW